MAITDKEAQNLRWAAVGSGILVGVVMALLWYEVKTEIPVYHQQQGT